MRSDVPEGSAARVPDSAIGTKTPSCDNDGPTLSAREADGSWTFPGVTDDPWPLPRDTDDPWTVADDAEDPMISARDTDDSWIFGPGADGLGAPTQNADGSAFSDPQDPQLPPGAADASPSTPSHSSSLNSQASSVDGDEEEPLAGVERPRSGKRKRKAPIRPDPPGSSLSDSESLRLLRKRCGISEEIVLRAPGSTDRAAAPPPGYFTLYENFFDQCLLRFPISGCLLRFLAANNISFAQINPKGLRHLIGVYVLSREHGVEISLDHLSYLLDFRARGRKEDRKYSILPMAGRGLIDGFPSKDEHFEDRFFFAEISEKTAEAGCVALVKTGWEERVKPAFLAVEASVIAAIHRTLASGEGHWLGSFSRQRVEQALSAVVIPGKVLGRAEKRLSSRQRAEAARLSGAGTSKTATPSSSPRSRDSTGVAPRMAAASVLRPDSPSLAPDEVARRREQSRKRALLSSGQEKDAPEETPSKRQRVDVSLPAGAATPVSGGAGVSAGPSAPRVFISSADGLLRQDAYALMTSKASELLLHLSQLVGDYDKDVRAKEREVDEIRKANAILQSKVDELAGRNETLEHEVLSALERNEELDAKLTETESERAKGKEEIALMRKQLDFAYDIQDTRIDEAVAKATDEMTRRFSGRVSELSNLLVEIDGKAKEDMLDLSEIEANLELVGLLQRPEGLVLSDEMEELQRRQVPIHDARSAFSDQVAKAKAVLDNFDAPGVAEDDVETDVPYDEAVEEDGEEARE